MQLGKSHEQLLQQDPSLPNGGGTRDLRKIETKDPEKLEDIEEMESVVGGTGSVVTGTGSVLVVQALLFLSQDLYSAVHCL